MRHHKGATNRNSLSRVASCHVLEATSGAGKKRAWSARMVKAVTALSLCLLWGCVTHKMPLSYRVEQVKKDDKPVCERIVTADVVALDQVYYYNRFGSFNPAGIMYALRRDVVEAEEDEQPDLINGDLDTWSDGPEQAIPSKPGPGDLKLAGKVKLRSDKRPRPLVLRANEGDCLLVTFTNLLSPELDGQEVALDPEKRLTHPEKKVLAVSDSDEPTTRHASMHVNGLSLVDSIDSQGANVGRNGWHRKNQHGDLVATDGKCSANRQDFGKDLCALAAPGETRTYTWYAKKEGAYLFYSMGAPAGGEGDGGQIGLGLFGSVNVQPKGAEWYRSQVTAQELTAATIKSTKYGQPEIDYRASFKDGPRKDDPILNMLKCQGQEQKRCEILYSDLNAVIDIDREEGCERMGEGNACGKPYREFTTIFHDEITAVQAFDEIREESSPLSSLRDGMGINYGASGLGAMVVANRKKLGPSRECVECKLEEFFLTSWVHGDPAMVVGYKKDKEDQLIPIKTKDGKHAHDAEGRLLFEKEAKYPDDPSNVHHSYLGDPVRFRNMHAGPKETHVFHLHAHQWVEDKHDPLSHYLDSQTISPGAVFSYEVHYGGSGNRNLGPGDSIFHCHLYPHFAQGMWELWRTHDVFENGRKDRRLYDHEITDGTPNPAIVPLPRTPLPPMPADTFKGYPFYIAGVTGHRPPQPPLDLEGKDDAGTLQRHVILGGTVRDARDAQGPEEMKKVPPLNKDLYDRGRKESAHIASRVSSQNRDEGLIALARELKTAQVEPRLNAGEPSEQTAMKFHAGDATVNGAPAVKPGDPGWTYTPYNWKAPGYRTCLPDGTCDGDPATHGARILFRVNGEGNQDEAKQEKTLGKPGAPFSNPCPKQFVDENGMVHDVKTREYRTAYIQMDMTVNKAGWHDPQARLPVLEEDLTATLAGTRPTEPLFFRANSGECVVFKATNLIPSNLNVDDFQVYSPTDTMGQHIHLVKFDVTSSDGSGNGWNYEDGTLAADEVRERIVAHNRYAIEHAQPGETPALFEPKTHRLFLSDGAMFDFKTQRGDQRGICPPSPMKRLSGETTSQWVERWEKWGQNAALEHPWCGAQTTIQRWWADPVLNGKPGEKGVKDRTLRTVFTHDHFGPSSHQHHGFYAALVIEPRSSKWFSLDGQAMGGTDAGGSPAPVNGRKDGGPTSYAANIIVRDQGKACLTVKSDGVTCSDTLDNKTSIDTNRTGREFNLAFADFAIVYDKENQPINPPSQIEGGLRIPILPGRIPVPEGISTKDPGTQLINYRNEPIPLRIGEQDKNSNQFKQRLPAEDTVEEDKNSKKTKVIPSPGNLAHVFASTVHEGQDQNWLNACRSQNEKEKKSEEKCLFTESYDRGRIKGDPATPLLRAYEGDHVQIRLIQGAQEEQHVFTMHGSKWLAQPDSPNTGYVNAQQIGISEHFEFNDRVVEFMPFDQGNGLSGGGHRHKVVDHLYSSAAADNLWDGQWGLMRVYSRTEEAPALARLPGNTEKTHDVLASAFVQKDIDERFDSEELEVSDENPADTGLQEGQQALPSKDALEAFCRTDAQKTLSRTFEVQAWLAKDLLPDGKLVYNKHFGITDPNAILFVEAADVSKLKSGSKDPEPLILRARAGDCIHVTLTNKIDPVHHRDGPDDPEGKTWSYNMVPPIVPGFSFNQVRSSNHVGLHPQLVDYNLQTSDGAHVGLNDDSTVGPGDSKTYLWYAGDIATNKKGNRIVGTPYEFGAIALQDMGDVIKHASHGAIGALIVEPQCSRWDDAGSLMKATVEVTYWKPEPVQGRYGKRWKKQVCPLDETWLAKAKGFMPYGKLAYYKEPAEDSGTLYRFKEMVLLYQDNLSLQQYGQPLPNLRNGDDSEDSGQKAFNYRTEPLWARLGASAADEPDTMSEFDWSNVLSSTVSHFRCDADFSSKKYCDPETPLFKAKAGEPVRFRVVHPGGHPRQHGFTVFGHDWSMSPWIDDSKTMGWNQFSRARVGSTSGIGPGRDVNIMTSAGGDCAVPGDYLYRTQEGFMFGGGLWGILRVEENPGLKENPGLAWYQPSWGWAGRMFGYQVNADVCRVDLSTADTASRK